MNEENEYNGKPSFTVKEFYDFLVRKMTPEEVLMKLLGGNLEIYKKLKENKPLDETDHVNPLFIIAASALDMGWDMMLEKMEEDSYVRGIAVGSEEYLRDILEVKEEEVYAKIEHAIINWAIESTETAGTLTRRIIGIVNNKQINIIDTES